MALTQITTASPRVGSTAWAWMLTTPTRTATATPDGDEDLDGDRLTHRFEIHRSHTDPRLGDTDRDGVRDGAEDPDHDQVSNAGEAVLGTQPNHRDSDPDGRDDWHEDVGHDGLPNGREQDQRAMPKRLRSELPTILAERPSSHSDGCHAEAGDVEARPCSYGDLDPETAVVLLGDSHAVQWLAAFSDIARRNRWHLYVLTKSGCPVPEVSHLVRPGEIAEDRNSWRADAFVFIEALHPDLIVAASRMDYHLEGSWGDRAASPGTLTVVRLAPPTSYPAPPKSYPAPAAYPVAR